MVRIGFLTTIFDGVTFLDSDECAPTLPLAFCVAFAGAVFVLLFLDCATP